MTANGPAPLPFEKFRSLTPSEKAISLMLARDGLKTEEIARNRCNSVKTINRHKENIFNKLDVDSVTKLVIFIWSNGFVSE